MKSLNKILAIVGIVAFISSCTTIYPVTATNNPIGSKTGSSKTGILFGGAGGNGYLSYGITLNGDYGVIEAAEKGNIEKVATVDIKATNYIIFTKAEIIVTGE